MKKHEPKIFAKVAKVLLPKDYIRLRMTGEYASDMSDSSGTYWLDIAKRDWSEKLLAATDMSIDQMPKLYEGTDATGRLTPAVAKAWGMPKRPVVAGGGGDNAAAACGIGAVTDNSALVSIGTSGVHVRVQRHVPPQCGPRRPCLLPCRAGHLAPDGRDPLGRRQASNGWRAFSARLRRSSPAALGTKLTGPSPALMLPYLSGERTPVADAQVRGLIMGLGHESDHKTLTHAALDAVAFAFRDSLEALKDAGTEVKRVTAVGGGSKSELWLKIIATVLGVPVDLPAAGDVGGAFGAARLGLIAATGADFRKVLTAPKTARTIKPEPKARDAYEEHYRRYVKIYPAIKEIYR